MNRLLKRILIGLGGFVVLVGGGGGAYAMMKASAFDASMNKVYDIPLPALARSTDPAVLPRGKHLAEALAGCATRDCHGADGAGGQPIVMGPLGTMTGPNITSAGLGAAYSDGELARLLRHGVKKDGRSVRFMPAQDINWLPDADIVAVISYIRSLPAVDKPNGPLQLGLLAKVLDQREMIPIDIARHIDHANIELAPPAAPTKEYGRFIVRLCTGCHGPNVSGGPIPGAPPSMPVPLNLTPDATGLKDWSYEDFDKLLTTGIRKNGKPVDPMMPSESFGKMDETEKRALWAGLQALPPTPFGNR